MLLETVNDLTAALDGDPSPQQRMLIEDVALDTLLVRSLNNVVATVRPLRKGKAHAAYQLRASLILHRREHLKLLGLHRVAKTLSLTEILTRTTTRRQNGGWRERRMKELCNPGVYPTGEHVTRGKRGMALWLLCEVEERGDFRCLGSELDRKVDESFDLERRGSEVNPSVIPGPNIPVLAAAVIREDYPLVLALPQVVLDELVNQLVGEMLEDVLGYEQVRSGEVIGDVTDLKLDIAFLVLLTDGLDHIGGDVDPEVARVAPVDRARETPIPAARVDDRLDGMLLHEVFDVGTILLCDLQGRSPAAGSLARDVLAPCSFRIDAIEGVGQSPLVDGIDRKIGKHQRSDQDGGNGDWLLHRISFFDDATTLTARLARPRLKKRQWAQV